MMDFRRHVSDFDLNFHVNRYFSVCSDLLGFALKQKFCLFKLDVNYSNIIKWLLEQNCCACFVALLL